MNSRIIIKKEKRKGKERGRKRTWDRGRKEKGKEIGRNKVEEGGREGRRKAERQASWLSNVSSEEKRTKFVAKIHERENESFIL